MKILNKSKTYTAIYRIKTLNFKEENNNVQAICKLKINKWVESEKYDASNTNISQRAAVY